MRKVPISSIADVTAGQGAPKPDEFSDSGIPFVRAGSLEDLLSGKSESDLELVPAETAKKRKLKLYPSGSILFAKSGMSATKDRIYVLQNPAHVVSHLAILTPKDNVYRDYLRLALKQFPPSSLIKDPAYPAIGLGEIQGYEIPVPEEIDDQKRIAHLLGKVEGLIAQRKQHLQQLDDLLKSVFLDMFGDPITNPRKFPVRKLSEFYINPKDGTKCGPFGSALKKDELVDSGIPVWNMDNIDPTGRMVLPFRMWITKEKYKELASYSVIDGDIIISRAGTVGKMCVARMDGESAIISTNLIRLRLGDKLRPLHVVSLMNYCKGRVGRLKKGADGAFTHMNTGILDKLEFPYPPTELQDQFATIVEKVEGLKSRYQHSLTDLENLYGALSQKAFKGELDLSRVVLPAEGSEIAEEEKTDIEERQPMEPLFELPAPEELALLHTAEGRKSLLGEWLNSWLAQLDDAPFTAQAFMDAARQRLWELVEDDVPDWGAAEYDELKAWMFEAIEQGRLTQGYDDTNNRVQITASKG